MLTIKTGTLLIIGLTTFEFCYFLVDDGWLMVNPWVDFEPMDGGDGRVASAAIFLLEMASGSTSMLWIRLEVFSYLVFAIPH
jgi:hypothetical protein